MSLDSSKVRINLAYRQKCEERRQRKYGHMVDSEDAFEVARVAKCYLKSGQSCDFPTMDQAPAANEQNHLIT